MKKKLYYNILKLIILSYLLMQSVKAIPEYDLEIINAFENNTWIRVLVRLEDNSNIAIIGTKEERRELLIQRDSWFDQVIEDVIEILPITEFNNLRKRSDGFSLDITEVAFNLLINDSRIDRISLIDIGAKTTDNKTLDNSSVVEINTTEIKGTNRSVDYLSLNDKLTLKEENKEKDSLLHKIFQIIRKLLSFIRKK